MSQTGKREVEWSGVEWSGGKGEKGKIEEGQTMFSTAPKYFLNKEFALVMQDSCTET